ncbi:hypothetical protein BDF21DRAFT_399033 [Thamnidium elegans]|nr:hypothetical protein BDF21DRAFT_399033 [Thamnidium elegans]
MTNMTTLRGTIRPKLMLVRCLGDAAPIAHIIKNDASNAFRRTNNLIYWVILASCSMMAFLMIDKKYSTPNDGNYDEIFNCKTTLLTTSLPIKYISFLILQE